jgi:hypothetical protein
MDGTEACKYILDYYQRYIKKIQIYGNNEMRNSLRNRKNLEAQSLNEDMLQQDGNSTF